MSITIYHNPRCSKSRQTLALIREHGVEPTVVEYLKQPPTPAELKRIIDSLGVSARDILRRGEAEYRELNLDDPALDEDQLITAVCAHPGVLERPIVIRGDRACLGRPPENVEALLT